MASPFRFVVVTNKGAIPFEANNVSLKKDADGLVSWTASSTQGGIRFENQASMEYDGYVHYDLKVSSDQTVVVKDIRLETNYTPYASEYFMGTDSVEGLVQCPINGIGKVRGTATGWEMPKLGCMLSIAEAVITVRY